MTIQLYFIIGLLVLIMWMITNQELDNQYFYNIRESWKKDDIYVKIGMLIAIICVCIVWPISLIMILIALFIESY